MRAPSPVAAQPARFADLMARVSTSLAAAPDRDLAVMVVDAAVAGDTKTIGRALVTLAQEATPPRQEWLEWERTGRHRRSSGT